MSSTTTVSIEVDLYSVIDADEDKLPVILSGIFAGDLDIPEHAVSFADALDSFVDYHSIPSNPISMRVEHKEEALLILNNMVGIINEKIRFIKEDIPVWEDNE